MCSISFYKDNNFGGSSKIFTDAQAVPDLSQQYYEANDKDDLKKDSDSIKTSANSWAIVFNNTNYKGDFLQIGPSSSLSDLNHVDRNSGGDWKNQIQSFIMYDAKPPFWDAGFARPYIDNNKLAGSMPNSYSDDGNSAIAYEVQDSTYRIHCPVLSDQDITSVTYSVSLDHENAASKDDHASFLIVFDNNGQLLDIKSFNWNKGGAFNISSDVVSDIEDGIDFIGDLADPVTDGASSEAAKYFDKVFSLTCKLFNFAAADIYKYTDNGGMYYFLPVICHTINRLSQSAIIVAPDYPIVLQN